MFIIETLARFAIRIAESSVRYFLHQNKVSLTEKKILTYLLQK